MGGRNFCLRRCRAGATAIAVGQIIGIDQIHANMSPADKHRVIGELQAQGRIVAVAGYGINDAPALARADVGIAMGTGTDVTMSMSSVMPCGYAVRSFSVRP